LSAPIHLQPNAPLAERVLLPGDPGRALRLAQALLEAPKMFNHHRGLWGYTGRAADGEPLTIQSTGMGGPSSAIVVWELIELGARLLVRVGTCGALRGDLSLGQLLIATDALADDGTSRALGASERISASPAIAARLRAAAAHLEAAAQPATAASVAHGPVVSTDLFYGVEDRGPAWLAAGAAAGEMEAATLFALAERRSVEAGCALIVSDLLVDGRERIAVGALQRAELALGELAARAVSRRD
jgi:DeoD family purine-nucleoside phosphorylase